MSMPTFPESGLDITCEQAFNMLLASIAMEELALSHIMNAEGEKIQFVLAALRCSCKPCACTQQIIEVNDSVTRTLDAVLQNQLVLKGKLQQVLDARARLCPPKPKPPCPPHCCHRCCH